MKAIKFEKPGGLEVLQLVDVEQPTPGQVSINACNNCSLLAAIALSAKCGTGWLLQPLRMAPAA